MPRRSPLHAVHRERGARLTDFGGWEMPLSYPAGTVAEHLACRQGAALFDVSHLGTVRVRGADALDRLQGELANDLTRIAPGRAQYTHLLNEAGGVVDDIIVWWVEPERFDVMPNASNTANVVARLGGDDVTSERAVLAVQGPDARRRVAEVSPGAAAVARFRVAVVEWEGYPLTVAGTGYTGEAGIEIAVPAAAARSLFDALVDVGIVPAGLGARDTLRLEAGLPLHGQDLGPDISPLEAGLSWAVGWNKPAFRGRSALVGERERGPSRRLVGLATEGRRPPRAGSTVRQGAEPIGTVTSGNFSPVLGHGIALALLVPEVGVGDQLTVEVRGSDLDARLVDLPFVTASPSTWSL